MCVVVAGVLLALLNGKCPWMFPIALGCGAFLWGGPEDVRQPFFSGWSFIF